MNIINNIAASSSQIINLFTNVTVAVFEKTARIAKDLDRKYLGYDISPEYVKICEERLKFPLRACFRKKKSLVAKRNLCYLFPIAAQEFLHRQQVLLTDTS